MTPFISLTRVGSTTIVRVNALQIAYLQAHGEGSVVMFGGGSHIHAGESTARVERLVEAALSGREIEDEPDAGDWTDDALRPDGDDAGDEDGDKDDFEAGDDAGDEDGDNDDSGAGDDAAGGEVTAVEPSAEETGPVPAAQHAGGRGNRPPRRTAK